MALVLKAPVADFPESVEGSKPTATSVKKCGLELYLDTLYEGSLTSG